MLSKSFSLMCRLRLSAESLTAGSKLPAMLTTCVYLASRAPFAAAALPKQPQPACCNNSG